MLLNFSPDFLKKLQTLKVRTRRKYIGSQLGTHRSPRKGHGLEFAEFKGYTPGDDFRHIDWGILARTDKFYIRQFQEEQNLNILIILDISSSMFFPKGQAQEKIEFAKKIALALSYVALSEGDVVQFAFLGKSETEKYSSLSSFHRATKSLETLKEHNTEDLKSSCLKAIAKLRMPGKCFIISDFLYEHDLLFPALDMLKAKNFETTLLQVLSKEEVNLDLSNVESVIDSESGEEIKLSINSNSIKEYKKLFNYHIQPIETYCKSSSMHFLSITSDENLEEFILKTLPTLGILQ